MNEPIRFLLLVNKAPHVTTIICITQHDDNTHQNFMRGSSTQESNRSKKASDQSILHIMSFTIYLRWKSKTGYHGHDAKNNGDQNKVCK